MSQKEKIVVVVGPTASGKTDLAITIAEQFTGEVISADSRQVYRGLDVGTAKVTVEEMRGVPHHLIDVADVTEVFTVTDFKAQTEATITDITNRSKLPIIAGGTFFYVDALLGKTGTAAVPPNPELRADLEQESTPGLFAKLQTLDPNRAAAIDEHNPRRLIRAIEIATALGTVPKATTGDLPYETLIIGIDVDREELRARIEARAPQWLKDGLVEEICGLLETGVTRERLHEIGFEYQVGLELVDSQITEEEFLVKIVQKNWQYAKRQLTWLKRDPDIEWYARDQTDDVLNRVQQFLG